MLLGGVRGAPVEQWISPGSWARCLSPEGRTARRTDKEEVPGSSPGSPTLGKYLQSKLFPEIALHGRAPLEPAFGCNMGASGFSGAAVTAHSDRVAAPRLDTNVSPVAARRPGPCTLVSGAGAA